MGRNQWGDGTRMAWMTRICTDFSGGHLSVLSVVSRVIYPPRLCCGGFFCGALSGLMMDEAIAIPGRLAPGWAVRSRRDRMGRDANEAHVAVLKRSLRILRPADGSNGLGESNRSIAVCVASSGVDAGTRMTPIMRMFTDFKFQLRSHIEPGNESSGGCSVAAVIGRRQWWHALSNIGMPSVSLCA